MTEPTTENETATRAGFVAVVGPPNAGKSTLVNALVGTKVSIVSPKVQTTRFRVLGVALQGASQIVLVDTPGIFAPKRRLERAMVAAAWQGTQDADQVCLVVDATRGWTDDTRELARRLRDSHRPVLLILNKVDQLKKDKLLALAGDETGFADVFFVSALTGDGVAELKTALADAMPEGHWLFPEDQVSDIPQRLLAAEITREKAFLQIHDEIPYGLAVETESWTEKDDGSIRIDQTIHLLRDSQKPIVVGKGGERIKAIGSAARRELEEILECRVHLFLHVKVSENWIEKRGFYSSVGLDYDS